MENITDQQFQGKSPEELRIKDIISEVIIIKRSIQLNQLQKISNKSREI